MRGPRTMSLARPSAALAPTAARMALIIERARCREPLSQSDVACLLGISRSSAQAYERRALAKIRTIILNEAHLTLP